MFSNIFKSKDKPKAILTAIVFVTSIIALASSFVPLYQYVFPKDNLPALIELEPYVSDWVGGGNNADRICGPRKMEYAAKNPKYEIEIRSSEEHRKHLFGRVEYKYFCRFIGRKKS